MNVGYKSQSPGRQNMSDIFLSYAREDLSQVLPLVQALERHGWAVWWDRTIPPGKTFDRGIQEALDASRCVIVVWSRASVDSDWVKAEAEEGRRRGILIPVMIDEARIPLGFRQIQTARLVDWQGTEAHEGFDIVMRALTDLLGPPTAKEVMEPEPPAEPQIDAIQPGDEEPSVPKPEKAEKADTSREEESRQKPDQDATREIGEREKATPFLSKTRLLLGVIVVTLSLLILTFYFVISPKDKESSVGQVIKGSPKDKESSVGQVIKGMEFVPIPAGKFTMGSTNGSDDERPPHEVTISKPFEMGKYEATQAQWEAVMGNNPSHFTGEANRLVENVSWEDVQKFIRKLNDSEGGTKYRLPTEAEWEYAARAGSTTTYSFGDDSSRLGEYAWYSGNSGGKTHPVGQLKPNAWGLYDMHGNVWEWVQDWYGKYSAELVTDPQGPSSGSGRMYRGGSWHFDARGCRSAYRGYDAPGSRDRFLGFRLLKEQD
jgi:formylglycine-generating enzyme required for sulfatase activity